jgi:hypothetical protein
MLLCRRKWFPLLGYLCFFNSAESAYLEQERVFSTSKIRRGWMYSFEKLSPFSQGNHVLVATASKRHGCLLRDTCVSSTELISPIWNKMSLFHIKTYDWKEVFFSKTNPILTGKAWATCCSFYHR